MFMKKKNRLRLCHDHCETTWHVFFCFFCSGSSLFAMCQIQIKLFESGFYRGLKTWEKNLFSSFKTLNKTLSNVLKTSLTTAFFLLS